MISQLICLPGSSLNATISDKSGENKVGDISLMEKPVKVGVFERTVLD